MNHIYKVGDNYLALSQKQVENLINKRDNYDIREREIVQELARGNCLDIGANIGYFTVIMAKSEMVNEVYAFEPDPINFEYLKMNVNLNRVYDKVIVSNDAVSNENNFVKLYKCEFNDGMHRIYPSKWCSDEYETVGTTRIDDEIPDKVTISFVKLDIEGSEYGALKGMEQLLKRDHPTIMMEFHCPSIEEAGDNPEDILDFLIDLGYTIQILDDWGKLHIAETSGELGIILDYCTKYPAVNLMCK